MIKDGATWRPPAVNETCCMRPTLADTLQKIAAGGPDVLYTGEAGQVAATFSLLHHACAVLFSDDMFCFRSCVVW